jgi:hypothetical protein
VGRRPRSHRDVCCRADDDAIVSVIDRAGKTGIDCPFG